MSYTVKIKEEISKLEGSKSETIAELSAYIRNNGNITRDKITMTTENKVTVDKVTNILKDLYLVNSKVEQKSYPADNLVALFGILILS